MPYIKFSELPQVAPSGYMFFPVVDPTQTALADQNKRVAISGILSPGGVVNGPLVISNTGSLVFEGAVDDAYETTLTVVEPTADQTVSLPNATTTLAGLSVVQTFTSAQRGVVTALTSATTVTPDFSVSNNFSLTLGHTVTIANPTNLTAGQSGAIVITQGSGTAYTVAYGSNWKFSGGTPTMSTGLSSVSTLVYYVESSSRITAQLLTNVA
jgi:hypothetical protein